MRHFLLSALAIVAGMGTMCATSLFSGEQAVTWSSTLTISAEQFANVAIGDILKVTIAEGGSDVIEFHANGSILPGTILTRVDSKTEVNVYVTEQMQTALKAYGLELCGPSFTVTSIDLNATEMTVPDGAIWVGYFWIDTDYDTIEIYKTAFSGQNPQKILINFSDEANSSTFELKVLTAWDDDDYLLSSSDNLTISGTQAVLDLQNLADGRTFDSYFTDSTSSLMIQGHVTDGSSFNITSVVLQPYESTGIENVAVDANSVVDVYSLSGVKVRAAVDAQSATADLTPGIYVVGGNKVLVK